MAEHELPRVQGKVLGFRAWHLQGYKLRSLFINAYWTIGVNEAQCLCDQYVNLKPLGHAAPVGHAAPHPDCECGFYCIHDQASLGPFCRDSPDHLGVLGAVLAWGRIEVHEGGFRAQYAEPVMFAYHHMQPYEQVCRAKAVMSEMGLPFVPLEELGERARAFGEPVAPELRPVLPTRWEVKNPATTSPSSFAPRRWAALGGIATLANLTLYMLYGHLLSLIEAIVAAVAMIFYVWLARNQRVPR